MKVRLSFTDLEVELLDSVNAKPADLISAVNKAMPGILKDFYLDALKKKGVFCNEKKTQKKNF